MRIYIISAVYPPEPMTSASMARDIAEEMTRRGHDVTVFAPFPNRPCGEVYSHNRRCWRKIEYRDGYRILYTWSTLSKRSTLVSRLAENITFGLTSTLQLIKEPRPDVVYMNTWPLLAQWMNASLMSWRRAPVICAVKDLYPESFVGGREVSGTNPVIRIGRMIDNQVYKHSALVVPLNSLMKDYMAANRAVSPEKIRAVYDWVDASSFLSKQSKSNSFRKQHGFPPNLFIAMYVGSMTRMAGLELYVQAAELLRHRRDIRILLVGDGAMREKIELMIQQKNLENIQVIFPLTPKDVPEVQSASDVLMLSLLPGGADHALPSKLIYYMLSQRPVLASVKSDGPPARIIQEAACGYTTRQGSPNELAAQIEKMAKNRQSLDQLGENARRYAEDHFLKDNVLPQFCNLIEKFGENQCGGKNTGNLREPLSV